MFNNNLAIIIPAYKIDFLDAALDSIAQQTDKRFTVYIGDDASPSPLYEIVRKYEDRISIVYKRFDENIGGHNLIGQWHRCIEMAGEEKWLWLFSDDDTLDTNCVASFYEALKQYPDTDLFHFNIRQIDDKGKIIKQPESFPQRLKIIDFNRKKWQSSISSYVVEYIFRKESFIDKGRFEYFEHAWHSDEATWTKIGWDRDIITIPRGRVNWRRSSVNITPDVSSNKIIQGKLNASIAFAKWVILFYENHNTQLALIQRFHLAKRFVSYLAKCKGVGFKMEREYIKNQLKVLDLEYLYPLFLVYLFVKVLKKR